MVGTKKETEQKGLIRTMKSLDVHMQRLSSHYEPHRYLWMGFLRGIVYGLGILVSIALVLPFLLWILGMIDWIPYVGDIIAEIVQRMEMARY